MSEETKVARTLVGQVVSNRMDKTIAVMIERRVEHPLYRKYVRKSTRLLAHDENNECTEGDTVDHSNNRTRKIDNCVKQRLHRIQCFQFVLDILTEFGGQ